MDERTPSLLTMLMLIILAIVALPMFGMTTHFRRHKKYTKQQTLLARILH